MSFIVPEHRRKVQPGQRFGRWLVVGVPFWLPHGRSVIQNAVCLCDCGHCRIVTHGNLIRGTSKSCGCVNAETHYRHGMSRSRMYRCWADMKDRCTNDNSPNFPRYGGRGITFCEEWNDFHSFMSWANGSGYSDNLELDRIDVNGGYSPGNCRWSTDVEQSNNRRCTLFVSAFGENKSLSDWSRDGRCRVSYNTLFHRISKGMRSEDAISKLPSKGWVIR